VIQCVLRHGDICIHVTLRFIEICVLKIGPNQEKKIGASSEVMSFKGQAGKGSGTKPCSMLKFTSYKQHSRIHQSRYIADWL
jgi:hypothetical protein